MDTFKLPIKVWISKRYDISSFARANWKSAEDHEPITCFRRVRRLDVQIHHLDRTLVYHRALHPIYLLNVECQASGSVFTVFSMIWSIIKPGFQPFNRRVGTPIPRPLSWYDILWVNGRHCFLFHPPPLWCWSPVILRHLTLKLGIFGVAQDTVGIKQNNINHVMYTVTVINDFKNRYQGFWPSVQVSA